MNFKEALLQEILHNIPNNYSDNYDHIRFGTVEKRSNFFSFKSILIEILNKFNYYNVNVFNSLIRNIEASVKDAKISHYKYLFNVLENDESRQLLIKLVAYRILGYKKVKLPLSTPEYWRMLKKMESLIEGNEIMDIHFNNFIFRKYNLQKIGYPVVAFLSSVGVLVEFVLEQYKYSGVDKKNLIEAEKGDIVIDAGAFFGDTALYFACKTGESGRVYSFEFIKDNINFFNKNCALNPHLESSIELVPFPLWSKSDIPIFYSYNGPASRVSFDKIPNATGQSVTKSIDDFVNEKQISRIDFIKMDIEGAELNALMGAVNTIKKNKPKLAICLYHSIEDFGTIPKFINDLNLGYKFYLGHSTIHKEETVLFASVK